jgi:hypothetical protein
MSHRARQAAGNSPRPTHALLVGRGGRSSHVSRRLVLLYAQLHNLVGRQYDMREPHECPTQSKVLINLCQKSEIKCVAVNPTKPHYIAVGANDCFVRLYDRRMIKLSMVDTMSSVDRTSHSFMFAGQFVKENAAGTPEERVRSVLRCRTPGQGERWDHEQQAVRHLHSLQFGWFRNVGERGGRTNLPVRRKQQPTRQRTPNTAVPPPEAPLDVQELLSTCTSGDFRGTNLNTFGFRTASAK